MQNTMNDVVAYILLYFSALHCILVVRENIKTLLDVKTLRFTYPAEFFVESLRVAELNAELLAWCKNEEI